MNASKSYLSFSTIRSSFSHDFVASISVALVALPLGLGIAIASGAPPLAGLIPAVIGGLITTFMRGSHVAINGPSNGLIVVTLSAIATLGDYQYVLAAFVVAGILQVVAGLLRLGRFGDYLPSAVITGMLAAIGVIIMSRQVFIALGTTTEARSTLQALLDIGPAFFRANGIAVIIAAISLTILILHPRSRNRIISFVPAPMWVMMVALPLVYVFHISNPHTERLWDWSINVGPNLLVPLPEGRVWENLPFPDFALLGTVRFWVVVLSVFFVATIESLLSAKAVDKLDPEQRKTVLNRDLSAMGISTVLSAFIGGLPVITVILRSSVNVNHGARTRWSNFYHGALILVMVLALGPIIRNIPLAALAAILVFTGYKLTSPKIYVDTLRKGWEQLVLLVGTLVAIMLTGLLSGIAIGIVGAFLLHWAKAGIPLRAFWRYIRDPQIRVTHEDEHNVLIRIKGIINFLNLAGLVQQVKALKPGKHVVMDFSHTRLLDYGALEFVHEHAEHYNRQGGEFDLTGLAIHRTTSAHPYALHVLETERVPRLSRRQIRLKQMAGEHHWSFDPHIDWDTSTLRTFDFFGHRPIEYKRNRIVGQYRRSRVLWEVSDITFDEGALLATEVHHTTIEVLHLPMRLPEFILEKEGFLDKVLQLAGQEDIDFAEFREFSSRYMLKGPDEEAVREFFAPELIEYFEQSDVYHLECKGKDVLVFRHLRLASNREVDDMITFCEGLSERLMAGFD